MSVHSTSAGAADLSPDESCGFDLVYWLAVIIGPWHFTGRISRNSGIAADLPRIAKRDGVLIGEGQDRMGCVCLAANPSRVSMRGPPLGEVLGMNT